MENTLEGINCRLHGTEEQIKTSERQSSKITQSEQQKKKKKKNSTNKDGLRASETTSNILTLTLRCPRGSKEKKGAENIFEEITAENFPNLTRETDIQAQKKQS